MMYSTLPSAEIIVVGAGVVGLSIALELRSRGANIAVLDRRRAAEQASAAAAGMLASSDPHNPVGLQALSAYSIFLYDEFLERISSSSGLAVPYQTDLTVQYGGGRAPTILAERSLDPRQLAASLLEAVRQNGIAIHENSGLRQSSVTGLVIYTTGAWSDRFGITPVKGQMLRVQLPASHTLREVHRSEHVYIVPRTQGPQAGTALVGATVEDAGFDLTVSHASLTALRSEAAALDPSLRFINTAPMVEAWAGLRPRTPDDLPVIGRVSDCEFVATGHFRNGILLAPATAKVVADLVDKRSPVVSLEAFRPGRFAATASHT